jgi:hypothetical protein
MKKHILLNLSVDGYDFLSAIDEAFELSKQLGIGCYLNYKNQYFFKIHPHTTQLEIDTMKNQKIVIAV